jgi:hypothetical protein
VREGRRNEFAKFPEFEDPHKRELIPDPTAETTFLSARLDWSSLGRGEHARWLKLYRGLLAIRHREIVPRLMGGRVRAIRGDPPGCRFRRLADGGRRASAAAREPHAGAAGRSRHPGRSNALVCRGGDRVFLAALGGCLESAAMTRAARLDSLASAAHGVGNPPAGVMMFARPDAAMDRCAFTGR